MTYNLPLGTPLAGTKREILKLVRELGVNTTPVKPFLKSFRHRYQIAVSDKFDSAKFNGISKDICIMYIFYRDHQSDEYGIATYLEYNEDNSYEDMATMLEYILHYVDLEELHHLKEATENY